MSLKRMVHADHMPVNNYQMLVNGIIPIVFVTVEGLDEELETVDLPDRTARSGGNTKALSFTAKQMMHHTEEVNALERWYKDSQHPVKPDYLKNATLIFKSLTDLHSKSYALIECFPHKRVIPNADMNDEGKAAEITWTFRCTEIKHIPGM
jgi:hypothetical protein